MGILDMFDPKLDGWSFTNWGEANDFSWDLYRRTYLAINPTNDPVEAPLDVAFYQIFKSCAANGNCGGMAMLAIALFKYGGYLGFCSPPNFYAAAANADHEQPARADLHEAVNILQARQFSAAGIRNFVDVVNAGQLNDGVAAWDRIRSSLASGDYCMLSLSNGLFGDAAHTVVPYRAEMSGSTRFLWVYNPNYPYLYYPSHYDNEDNKIVINGPTSWSYDIYDGSNNGWFFAIPTSLELHKGRQPISAGFILTGLNLLFVSGTGASVTQIEDDEGRRLYATDGPHSGVDDLETSPDRRLPGVAPWPWPGGRPGPLPGELFFIQRPAGAAPLHVSVTGESYDLTHLSSGHLTELTAAPATPGTKDRVSLSGSAADDQSVAVSSQASERHYDLHHLRQPGRSAWQSVRLRDAVVTDDRLHVASPATFDQVEITGTPPERPLNLEFQTYESGSLRSIPLTPVPSPTPIARPT